MFTTLDTSVMDGPSLTERAVELTDGASPPPSRCSWPCRLPRSTHRPDSGCLIDAHDAGLLVEVVTDVDQREADAGTQLLLDAGVPVKLADDEMTYTEFGIGSTSPRSRVPSEYVTTILGLRSSPTRTGSCSRPSSAPSGMATPAWCTTCQSEDLIDDLSMEHNQLFGGTDASSLTAFSSMAKSIADARWLYPNQSGLELEVWVRAPGARAPSASSTPSTPLAPMCMS